MLKRKSLSAAGSDFPSELIEPYDLDWNPGQKQEWNDSGLSAIDGGDDWVDGSTNDEIDDWDEDEIETDLDDDEDDWDEDEIDTDLDDDDWVGC